MPKRQIAHYQVIKKLGEGGMGAVYQARDTILGNIVAIKTIVSSRLNLKGATERFLNEARAISDIDHPNVIRLHHVVQEGNNYYMIMQHLEGDSLRKIMSERPLPLDDVLRVACEIASALEQVHAHGIVHRDLKPDNIMITTEGVTKVLDFGVAHFIDFTSITSDDAIVGTLSYAAPEQIQPRRGKDERIDVYGLGVVMFEMLTGRLPFEVRERAALLYQILNQEPIRLSELRSDLPEGLGRIVDRALNKNPDDRYHSISEMLHDLEIIRSRVARAGAAADDRLIAKRRLTRGARRTLMVAALAVTLAVAGRYLAPLVRGPDEVPRIMVVKWENTLGRPELDWVAGAIMSGLIRTLGDLEGYNVISRQTVAATVQTFQVSTAGVSPISLGVAREVGAAYLISGSLKAGGAWVQFDCELTDMNRDGILVDSWSEEIADSTRIQGAVVELAIGVAEALGATWREDPRDPKAVRAPTLSAAALRRYQQALSAEERRDVAEALENLRAAVALDSTFAEAHLLLSRLSPDNAEQQESLVFAMKYRRQAPPTVRKLVEAANRVFEGQILPAIELYEEILGEDPEQVTARKALAMLYRRTRRPSEAASEYTVLHRISPFDYSFYREWAMTYAQMDRRDRAVALITDWRRRFPDREAPIREFLYLCDRLGNYQDGVALCDSLSPGHPVGRSFACGWLLELVGRLHEAEEIYLGLMESPDAELAWSRGLAYMAYLSYRRQNYARGLDYIDRALAHQEETYYHWLAGLLAAGNGQVERAGRHAEAIAREFDSLPDNSTEVEAFGARRFYYHLRGWMELSGGQPAGAVKWFEQSVKYTTPVDGSLFRTYLGRALMSAGRLDEAVIQFEGVLGTDRAYPEALLYLGKTLVLKEDYPRSGKVLGELKDLWRQADSDDPLNVELNRLITVAASHK